jgi:hypothetical protein
MTETTAPTCAYHPTVETYLRCNQCDKYICTKCAVRTPTGYRCKDCVRTQQKIFDTATTKDYFIVFFLTGFLSFLGGLAALLVTSIIWGIFVIGLGPVAGIFIANIVRRVIGNHRSRALNYTFAAAMIMGPMPLMFVLGLGTFVIALFGGGLDLMSSIALFGPIIWQLVFLVMAVPSAFGQFSGLIFRR